MKTSKKLMAVLLSVVMIVSGIYFVAPEGKEVKAEAVTSEEQMNTGVLDVKAQLSKDGTVMRLVTSVDSLNYHRVGFKITPDGGETTSYPIKTVFKRIASTTKGAEYEFSPKVVDTASEYFATIKLNIENENLKYKVQAYVILVDGETEVCGQERCIAASDGKIGTTTVNMSFDTIEALPEDVTEINNVTYGKDNTPTTATVIETSEDRKTVHVRVNVASSTLPSATKFTFGSYGSAIYRNLYTTHEVAGNPTQINADTSWYDVYIGENSSETEFVIATSADLYGFATASASNTFAGKTIYLVSNVAANEGEATPTGWDTTGEGATSYKWTSIGISVDHPFAGTFDGQGHTVSGIYLDDTQTSSRPGGLFGVADYTSKITNFKLTNSYLKRNKEGTAVELGSIIGEMRGGTLSSVYSDAIVTSNGYHIGGLVGKVICVKGWTPPSGKVEDLYANIDNCWFKGEVLAYGKGCNTGGIVGTAGQTGSSSTLAGVVNITNCLNTGKISCEATATDDDAGYQYIGGIIGRTHWAVITVNIENCLNTGKLEIPVANAKAVGSIIGAAQRSGSVLNVTNTNATKESYTTALDKESGQSNGTENVDVVLWSESDLTGYWGYANTQSYKAKNWCALDIYTNANKTGTFVIKENGTPELKTFSEDWLDFGWYYDNGGRNANDFTIYTAQEFYTLPIIFYGDGSVVSGAYKYKSYGEQFNGDIIRLGANITLNQGNASDWANESVEGPKCWTPIGTTELKFPGTFDGQGHSISGLYFNESSTEESYSGLFGVTEITASIKNFKLTNSYLKREAFTSAQYSDEQYKNNWAWLGSVIGHMRGGSMENVYSDAIVTSNGTQMGGLVGVVQYDNWGTHQDAMNVNINNCWFDGKIVSTGDHGCDLGGIAGVAQKYTGASTLSGEINITNCLNSGEIECKGTLGHVDDKVQNIGGIIGRDTYTRITININKCLNTGKITVEEHKNVGSIAGAAGFRGWVRVTDTYATNESYQNSEDIAVAMGTDKRFGSTDGTVTLVDENNILGNSAKSETGCPNLFGADSAWETVSNGTPILKYFASWWKARQ